jgi:hypothetical protein
MYSIYPKSISRTKLQPKKNQCFVLMPFASTFDEIYAEIKASLQPLGFACYRADDIYANRPIMTTIVCEILSSHFVIADFTDKNPNVFYEVGLAHAFREMASVILLAQSIESVPFDLRHLPVIIYQRDNLRGLTTRLIKRILENKDFFAGQIRLREKYLPQVNGESELEEIVDFLENKGREPWNIILHALDIADHPIEEPEIIYGIFELRADLAALASAGRIRLFRNLFKIYTDLVCRFVDVRQLADYAKQVLREGRFADFAIDETEMTSLLIDFAIALFSHPQFKRLSTEWIFEYLARPKVAGIDINRAKVEHFVLFADDVDLRETLIFTLGSQNSYMRETAADFIGEIRLESALGNLVFALERETSPFAARSIFSALGKIAKSEGAPSIIAWTRDHLEEIGGRKWDYIVDHAERAVRQIDARERTNYSGSLAEVIGLLASKAKSHQPRKRRKSD